MEKVYRITSETLVTDIRNDFGETSGTYILYWYLNNSPKKISRLLNDDSQGILYIGETDGKLYNRIGSLAKAIKSNSEHSLKEPKERGHKALSKKFFRIRKSLEIEDLYVEVRKTIESPEKDESKMLEIYVSRFGELPPLNGEYGHTAYWGFFC